MWVSSIIVRAQQRPARLNSAAPSFPCASCTPSRVQLEAFQESQKYKEGKVILEKARIVKVQRRADEEDG